MQVLPQPSAAPPSPNDWPVAVRRTDLPEGSGNTERQQWDRTDLTTASPQTALGSERRRGF